MRATAFLARAGLPFDLQPYKTERAYRKAHAGCREKPFLDAWQGRLDKLADNFMRHVKEQVGCSGLRRQTDNGVDSRVMRTLPSRVMHTLSMVCAVR